LQKRSNDNSPVIRLLTKAVVRLPAALRRGLVAAPLNLRLELVR
jgi:hypothetical protein